MQKPSCRSFSLLYPLNSTAFGSTPLAVNMSILSWLKGGLASKQQPPTK
jgi:hypothetical protein